ncbi:MAG TPA: class I SAM-dependent methyltransferase [Candidatus Acidoferrales bacterium]|nr:class I SAM-dependent methyltransferase [Candidatus Acidoferrales bacterium]
MDPYGKTFYDIQQAGSFSSAEVIVPLLKELVQLQSAIDVGCGVGTWVRALMGAGVRDVHGIDGAWVTSDMLQVPEDRFRPVDLSRPFRLGRRFDLALSLEVAEHLPAASADGFVESLVCLAPVVLFSAAVPFQGGTQHVNEQWPEYWANIFGRYGYAPLDCIRMRIWNDPRVEWWYSQNILLYANEQGLSANPQLAVYRDCSPSLPVGLIHPRRYLEMQLQLQMPTQSPGVHACVVMTLAATKRAILRRLKRRR